MGFVTFHLNKVKGNDAEMSSHIERTIDPANADKERTHLNRELIKFPDGVTDRTQAIQHRLDTAGLTRKIGTNQVRALRGVLTGTHEDFCRIEAEGKLEQWCEDSISWLRKTFGEANVVSAVLHMDERTPHIHATIIPIVTGERRKAAQEKAKSAALGKKQYRKKKTDAPRLCADDVSSRDKLIGYQDSYAEAMAGYGLERGIRGSEARHKTNLEFYREVVTQKEKMQAELEVQRQEILEQKQLTQQAQSRTEQAQAKAQLAEAGQKQAEDKLAATSKELSREKGKLTGQKFKNTATEAGTKIADGIGSMFGSSKIERQQQEIDKLKADNAGLTMQLGYKDKALQSMQRDYSADTERLKQAHENEADKLRQSEQTAKAKHQQQIENIGKWFPNVPKLVEMAEYCKTIRCSDDMIRILITGKPVQIDAALYSPEHNKRFDAAGSTLRIERHPDIANRFRLTINGTDIIRWFRQKYDEIQQKLGVNPRQAPAQSRGRGM